MLASTGGAGGGAGGHGYVAAAAASNTLTAHGGNGGKGGNGQATAVGLGGSGGAAAGGGGGDGGTALVVTAPDVSVSNTGALLGGDGGNGGDGKGVALPGQAVGDGGNGGNGGAGLSGTGLAVTNTGTIAGGHGGAGGASSDAATGLHGAGGAGISGAVSVVNSGSITGGLSGDGLTRANAITFSGSDNTLELQAGSAITGDVVASAVAGTTNTFILGGATNASFATGAIGSQYQNFNQFSKTGASTWTLTGATAAVTPWTISGGTLSIAADASLGATSGALTLDGGTLQTTADMLLVRDVTFGAGGGTFRPDTGTTLKLAGDVSGSGALTMSGAGTLELPQGSTHSGGTTLNSGTLHFVSTLALGSGVLTLNGGTLAVGGAYVVNKVVINGDVNLEGFMTLAGDVQLNNTVRVTLTGVPGSTLNVEGGLSGPGGITYDSTLPTYDPSGGNPANVTLAGQTANTYRGPTAVQGNVWMVVMGAANVAAVPGDLTISDNAMVASVFSEQIADHARVTVNSLGQSMSHSTGGVPAMLEGFNLATWASNTPSTETIGSLYGHGTVGLGSGTLRVGSGDFSGVISNGSYATWIATQPGGSAVGGKLEKYGPGTLTLSGANTYTDHTTVAQGILRAGAVNTFSPASATTVATGATLDLAGYSQTIAALTSSGAVSLAGNSAGTVLTVTGPWAGQGGTLAVGTALVGNASATDKLLLSGAAAVASGSTQVAITNLGGLGGQTTGNGIEIVGTEGGASIQGNAFSLRGPVVAGAYEYRLNTTTAGAYLSSTAVPPAAGPAPASQPLYRTDVPLYAALPEQLRQANLAMLGSMHQRVGDDGVGRANPEQGLRQGWGRVLTMDRHIQQDGTAGPSSEGRLTGFQTGTDLWADLDWRAGLYVGRLDGDMKVSGFAGGIAGSAAGANALKNDYVGGYLTYRTDTGLYVDGVLQAGRHRATLGTLGASISGTRGSSLLASVEVGQAFALARGWSVEPQLQLVQQRLNLDDGTLAGAVVQQHPSSSWALRAGLRLKSEFTLGASTLQPYARLNVWRTGSGTDRARFVGPAASADILTPKGGTSTEAALGASWQVSPAVGVYGELGQLWASGGSARTKGGPNASLGVKVRW